MTPQEIISRKRCGAELRESELRTFFADYGGGAVTDAQMAAFLMATSCNGMTLDETIALTRIFVDSGARIDLSALPGRAVDKHSTGGVGDSVSLLLVPIVAAAGVYAPMITGRGLGHTGGTLDKLESIPGYRADLDETRAFDVLRAVGGLMIGQSARIVPLDRRIYALRDHTAAIDVPPLIAASIVSKKIAGGAQALVLDITTGRGAFMHTEVRAQALAELLLRVTEAFGLETSGILSSMDAPLGRAVGNQLEVIDVIDCLRGRPAPDLVDVAVALAGMMIHLGRKAATPEEGTAVAREMLTSGLAYRTFIDLVDAHGGDARFIEDPLRFPPAAAVIEVHAPRAGWVSDIDALRIGTVSADLGAGRAAPSDAIDPTAGVVLERAIGDVVDAGDTLCRLYSSRHALLTPFRGRALEAFTISPDPPAPRPRILARFDAGGFSPWTTDGSA